MFLKFFKEVPLLSFPTIFIVRQQKLKTVLAQDSRVDSVAFAELAAIPEARLFCPVMSKSSLET